MRYRRANTKSATYFFTVNLANRQSSLLTEKIDILRSIINTVKQRHPFKVDAIVILPDHIHTIWSLIKSGFSRKIAKIETINKSRAKKGERGIWQRRFWEHQIRNEDDFEKHVNYIHYNPVKHGYINKAINWPYSSIHQYIDNGVIDKN